MGSPMVSADPDRGPEGVPLRSLDGSAEGFAGRFGIWIAGIWLVFLLEPVVDHLPPSTSAEVVALVAVALFALVYLYAFWQLKLLRDELLQAELPLRQGLVVVGVLVVLNLLEYPGLGEAALGGIIFVTATAAMVLPSRVAVPLVLLISGAGVVAVVTVPGWDADLDFPVFALVGAFLLWAVKQILARNIDLVRMRQENEALLLDQERNRFARDLHDILGHSLTVIAVKSELAGRLLESGDPRAAAEVADLERLSRDALADVRRAVHGYREITLPGEIARARGTLAAAGIEALVPTSVDDVVGDLRELFAWTIREGVTNVVRHSAARRCEIELTADRVVIRNDGVATTHRHADEGHGLRGLRERADAVGARLRAVRSGGEFILEVGP
ncbi:sensor histidine kinase [Nocardioides marmoribigeumensis]|uniref:Two-component system sensor histidine kinase DesK n=1 Tax=Nocardioides marmoribigeumensis TaxID=433649 RepID=A0ABU2BQE7_9ACTN|nr:histidine kinase [Nocardioides marmoribigeumensis]MDR7360856.1 two-component system sensor histidine kinase DesK [Nocardioides marmoribigeumensis]